MKEGEAGNLKKKNEILFRSEQFVGLAEKNLSAVAKGQKVKGLCPQLIDELILRIKFVFSICALFVRL